MKKLLLALALILAPSLAYGQCTGVFPAGALCGNPSASNSTPRPTNTLGGPFSATTLTATQGVISANPFGGQATLQLGSPSVAAAPYIDFHAGASNPGFDTRLITSSNGAISGSGTLFLQGTFSIQPVTLTTQKAINIFMAGSTTTATGAVEPSTCSLGSSVVAYNLSCVGEGADTGGVVPTFGHIFALDTGGANSTGSKVALEVNLYKSANSNPAVDRDHVALGVTAQTNTNDGGTGLTPGVNTKGTLFASSFGATLSGGAQNYLEIAGTEVDIGIISPATAAYRFGWEVVSQGDTHGAVQDGAYVVGSTSSIGFKTGLLFTFANGSKPIATTGTVIGNDNIAATVNHIMDFSNWTVTGNIFTFGQYILSGTAVAQHVTGIAANTSADGLSLTNPTAATSGNQRYSPRFRVTGQGFQTSTNTSQTVDWTIENRPVQDTPNPSTKLVISSQINAAGYNERFSIIDSVTGSASTATLTSAGGATQILLSVLANNNVGVLYADGSTVSVGALQALPFSFITNNLTRAFIDSTGIFQFGAADAASPAGRTVQIQSVSAGTSNTAGINWTFNASRGTGTGAGGNLIWQVAPAGGSGSSQNSFIQAMVIDSLGHIRVGNNTAPALTSCGGGSPAIIGDDTAGEVTMGTTATGCVITFNKAYAAAPLCTLNWQATPLASQSWTVSTTAITTVQTSTSSNKLNYICRARNGG